VRAAEIDTSQAKDKSDRELLETMYSALVTADATKLNPNPPLGLLDRVSNIEQALVHRHFEGDLEPGGHMTGTVGTEPEGVT
jgi:hypothetical protein